MPLVDDMAIAKLLVRRAGRVDRDPRGRAVPVVAVPEPDLFSHLLREPLGDWSVSNGSELVHARVPVNLAESKVGEAAPGHDRVANHRKRSSNGSIPPNRTPDHASTCCDVRASRNPPWSIG